MTPALMTTRNNSVVSNWEWDRGYFGETTENEYPLRMTDSGPNNGLEMTLLAHNQGHKSLCTENDEDYIVILTAPGETADFTSNLVRVPMSTNSLLVIEPKATVTSEGLHSYTPKQRDCIRNSESQLAFFKIHTHENCALECLSNYTAMLCGCVPFYMPRMYF